MLRGSEAKAVLNKAKAFATWTRLIGFFRRGIFGEGKVVSFVLFTWIVVRSYEPYALTLPPEACTGPLKLISAVSLCFENCVQNPSTKVSPSKADKSSRYVPIGQAQSKTKDHGRTSQKRFTGFVKPSWAAKDLAAESTLYRKPKRVVEVKNFSP
jgi:hypothetical protein